MMEKLQRFGGAMFTPVLLFAYSGIFLSFAILFQSEVLFGALAAKGTLWQGFWSVVESGGWTVFNQLEVLFVIGIPIGLARHTQARAAMEAFVIYMTFNSFLSKILELWGPTFHVNFAQEAGSGTGLKLIAGVKTLDTNIIGAILIASIVVWIHNRYFDTKLPEFLGVFQGSSFVAIIGFLVMIPMAFLFAIGWPTVQGAVGSLQGFMKASGVVGVWLYVFLERILIPTGLHHFIYQPFIYGPAAVAGGIEQAWLRQLHDIAANPAPLIEQFPYGGFALHNMSKVFAPIGIGAAFYATAKPEKRERTLALVIPTALTAMLAGITEPFEFTFLFIAPPLFLVHSLLAATFASTLYLFGVVGDIGSGLIRMLPNFLIPMSAHHMDAIIKLFVIGFIYSFIYFLVFRFAILKFDYKTPGREDDAEVKMYTKKEYKEKIAAEKSAHAGEVDTNDEFMDQALIYMEALGGPENIATVNNCATRLRISVKDASKVGPDAMFSQGGAYGVVRKDKAIQVIVGLSVPQVRAQFEELLKKH